ncbi:MAG: ribosome silencing factor [Anaerolineae bacterium]|jgi:ribosome-associated protein|nr:ribosome silencing factor [Anaerolineae bacterium]
MEQTIEIAGKELAREIAMFLEEKFGEDIVVLDVHAVAFFTDYFVICTVGSDRQLRSLANDLVRDIRDKFRLHSKAEGQPESGWMVVDLGDIVVHMFSEEKRSYYQLEELWYQGQVVLRIQ